MRDRKVEGVCVTRPRQPVDLGTARIAEPEQARTLVEGFAGSVVDRRPEHARLGAGIANIEQERVAAAREQAQKRRLERFGLEIERGDMPVEVVDGGERQTSRPRDRLRRCHAHQQGADQPGPGRDADQLDLVEPGAALCEGLADHRRDELEMPPRGNLGDNASVSCVQVGLRRDDVRADPALGLLLTFGLALVAEQALRWIFGASPIPFSIPPELKGQVLIGDFIYSKYRLLMLAVAAGAVGGLWYLLRRTPFGPIRRLPTIRRSATQAQQRAGTGSTTPPLPPIAAANAAWRPRLRKEG